MAETEFELKFYLAKRIFVRWACHQNLSRRRVSKLHIFLYKMITEFQALYLGCVPNVSITTSTLNPVNDDDSPSTVRSADVQLIDRVENAQLDGRLPMTVETPKVRLNVSKHGVKLTDVQTSDVLDRYPLHTVAQAVTYDDGYGRFNVALKIGQIGKNQFACHVFQTASGVCSFLFLSSLSAGFRKLAC